MSAPVKKIFIDSRFRSNGTSSDFHVDLPDAIDFPDDWSCWVNSASFPHSWTNVNGNNNKFYFLERDPAVPATVYRRGFAVTEGNYNLETLAAALEAGLNTGTNVGTFTVTVSAETLVIASATTEFRVPSFQELSNPQWKENVWDQASFVNGALSSYSPSYHAYLNDFLGVPSNNEVWALSLTTGIIDLFSNHSLYLHSSLSNYGTVDPVGRKTILTRIPVEVAYGFTQQHRHNGLEQDCVDVSNLRVGNIQFSLRNVHGQVVDLRGSHVTLELVFGPTPRY